MQQRGAVLVQPRAGSLEPMRPDPRRQARAGRSPPQLTRIADGRQRRVLEQQPIGDTGYQPGDRLQDLASKRQMQKEVQEAQRSELGGAAGGGTRPRGVPQRLVLGPGGRYLPQGQDAPGRLTLTLTSPGSTPHCGYFPTVPLKHLSSNNGELPEVFRQGATVSPQTLQRVGAAMGRLVSPAGVSAGPTGFSPRNLYGPSPRNQANPTPNAARGFVDENTSSRFSSDAEKTLRSVPGRQDRPWKPSINHPSEVPIVNPQRRPLAQGDVSRASERRRGISKDLVDERLLRNMNPKLPESKGGRIPDRGKFQNTTGGVASEHNKTLNDVMPGRMHTYNSNATGLLQQRNLHSAEERRNVAVYQLEKFGRGGTFGPPHMDSQSFGQQMYGPMAEQFQGRSIPAMQPHQMPSMSPSVKAPMSSQMKKILTRASTDASQIALKKKTFLPVAKKTTDSPPKSQAVLSSTPLLASPVMSPINSPRPSLMMTSSAPPKNTVPGRITSPAKASQLSSPPRTPKPPSSTISPARTYVITPRNSPTAIPVPTRKNTARSPQAAVTGNVSTKLPPADTSVPPTTTPKSGKDRKGRYQNPKSRLPAGGDLHYAKQRPKASTEEAESTPARPPAAKMAVAATAEDHQSKEVDESHHQAKEEEKLTKTLPYVRKLTRTSNSYFMPVSNPPTPRLEDSAQHQEEDQGKSGNTMTKQPQVPLRKTNVGEGNKKPLPLVKNRKGTAAGPIHTEGTREPTRGRAAPPRHRRGSRGSTSPRGVDVAAALPDTSGNYTSAVHQWLRQSHYKIISPQQYRQHETIQEEKVKQPGIKEVPSQDARLAKAAAAEKQSPASAGRGGQRGRVNRPPRKQKEVPVLSKTRAAPPGKKASKAVSSTEGGKRKVAVRRGFKGAGARRKKQKEKDKEPRPPTKLAPGACRKMRPRRGPAGDSGDLESSASEHSSYLSASDEGMNELTAMC